MINIRNIEIRVKLKQLGITSYEAAEMFEVTPTTFSRWLNKPLSEDEKDEIIKWLEYCSWKKKENKEQEGR